jgi:hypothetical protein
MPRGKDLDKMIGKLDKAGPRVMSAAAVAVAASLRASVDAGYVRRKDVNGKTYIPAKDGHLPQMERSGLLRQSYETRIAGSGDKEVTIGEDTSYGEYLRDGTWKMAPRQHIPRPGEAMPPAWDRNAQRAIGKVVAAESRS